MARMPADGVPLRPPTAPNNPEFVAAPAPAPSRGAEFATARLSAGSVSSLLVAAQPIHSGAILATLAAASVEAGRVLQAGVPPRLVSESSWRDAIAPAGEATLTGEELESLPIAGRRVEDFSLDSIPEIPHGHDPESLARSPGPGTDPAALNVDGMSTRLAFGGRGSSRSATASLVGPRSTDSAIRELQAVDQVGAMTSGSPAEASAGLLTRSGAEARSGRIHGEASAFARQNLFSAEAPLSSWVKETSPASSGSVPQFGGFPWTPPDRSLRWSAALGGPLQHERLSWYTAIENERRDDPALAAVRHPDSFFAQPSNDELQLLSARLDLSSHDPLGEALTAYSSVLSELSGLVGAAPRTSTRWNGFGRLDWKPANRQHLMFQATQSTWDSAGGGFTRFSENYGNHSFGASQSGETWLAGRWDTVLSPDLLLVTQAALGSYELKHPASTPSPWEQKLNVNAWNQLPQIVVDSRDGFTIGNPSRFGAGAYPEEHFYEGRETAEWVRGQVQIRAGAELRYNADVTSFVRNHTGTYHYARVENFASDALAFSVFGLSGATSSGGSHNCDQRGRAWRDSDGEVKGLGNLPCYSWYSQTLGPTEWHLETSELAGFTTAQWQASRSLTLSAGLRWQREIEPTAIARLVNPDLPLAGMVPGTGSEWAPRIGLALGAREGRWPVLRLAYGMYYGRLENRTLETALTETGSSKADFDLFFRPTDNLADGNGDAPPFPYVLAGSPGSAVKPEAVEIAPNLRNSEIHQAAASFSQDLPGHLHLSVAAVASLGRRLPTTLDINFDPTDNPGTITYQVVDASGKGPLGTSRITVPFFSSEPSAGDSGRLNPDYGSITEMFSSANSTYEAGTISLSRTGRRSVSFHARYTYAHSMDWNPSENGLTTGGDIFDPSDFRQEYGPSNLDVRHSVSGYMVWRAPWAMSGVPGRLANKWMLSTLGRFHSGLPYSMRTAGSIPQQYEDGVLETGLGTGMNGYGGDNRVYGVGRNTYRYPATWKADARIAKVFAVTRQRELELMAESFNLFNHSNVTEVETTGYYIDAASSAGALPTLNFLTGLKTGQTEFGLPLDINAADAYRQRQFDFGLRLRFKRDWLDQR